MSGARVHVAGHGGLVGSALVRALRGSGAHLLTAPRSELDLADGAAVARWMRAQRPDMVLLAAARVGGVAANLASPTAFLRENLLIQTHVMHEAWRAGVERLVFIGSACAFPRDAALPTPEEAMLTGRPEPSNAPFAVAKAAGLLAVEAYRREHGAAFSAVIACNLYGLNDSSDPDRSHVVAALHARFMEAVRTGAPEVVIWGDGTARRELMHADDLARAVLGVAADTPEHAWLNAGSGEEVSIAELAAMLAEVTGFTGRLRFDPARPTGAPRRLLDSGRLRARGWRPLVPLRDGLAAMHRRALSPAAEAGPLRRAV